MKFSLPQQIERTAAQLRAAKPRSNLRLKLEIRLKELVTIQLKREIRQEKKAVQSNSERAKMGLRSTGSEGVAA